MNKNRAIGNGIMPQLKNHDQAVIPGGSGTGHRQTG